jgi:hypothetical protein
MITQKKINERVCKKHGVVEKDSLSFNDLHIQRYRNVSISKNCTRLSMSDDKLSK